MRGSEKVGGLTDTESRVWLEGYMLCADDYGVLEYEPYAVQAGSRALGAKPARVVLRCLQRLVEIGLLTSFEVQGKPYLCQLDWQDWQRIRWPRETAKPLPPAPIISRCSAATQELFRLRLTRHSPATSPDSGPDESRNGFGTSPAKESRVRVNGYGYGYGEGGSGETREAAIWARWRQALQAATGLTLRLSPTANEFANIRKLCDLAEDAVLLPALDRFAALTPAELQALGVKQKTLGWLATVLPQLVATKAVATKPCRNGHQPPCATDAICTKRAHDEMVARVSAEV
jgi:hypothetical protein